MAIGSSLERLLRMKHELLCTLEEGWFVTHVPHGMETGAGPWRLRSIHGRLPLGLACGTDYYAIVFNGRAFKLATCLEYAHAGHSACLMVPEWGLYLLEKNMNQWRPFECRK